MNMSPISHRQRLEVCVSGEKSDRPPVALWRHFPMDDQSPERLAAATLNFQQTYDFYFVKVTPASSYSVRDWGCQDAWRGNTEGTRDYAPGVVEHPEDWIRLTALNPARGSLGDMLRCLKILKAGLPPDTPIIQTIFSPLSQAKNLVGKHNLAVHLRRYPDAVHAGLKTIMETTQRFIAAALELGVDGVFYAVQHAQYGLLSESEFAEFGRAYDLQTLEAAQAGWFSMVHLHGEQVMFDAVSDYPVQALNWHDRDAGPTLKEARQRYAGVLCGGLRREQSIVLGAPSDVITEARDAIEATQGERFILGTGCVTPIIAPHGNLRAARQSVVLE